MANLRTVCASTSEEWDHFRQVSRSTCLCVLIWNDRKIAVARSGAESVWISVRVKQIKPPLWHIHKWCTYRFSIHCTCTWIYVFKNLYYINIAQRKVKYALYTHIKRLTWVHLSSRQFSIFVMKKKHTDLEIYYHCYWPSLVFLCCQSYEIGVCMCSACAIWAFI